MLLSSSNQFMSKNTADIYSAVIKPTVIQVIVKGYVKTLCLWVMDKRNCTALITVTMATVSEDRLTLPHFDVQ